jgi:hypothetical protein
VTNSAEQEKWLLDIGHGLKVGFREPEGWRVWAKNGCFELIETMDYFRVVVLLERTYSEAKKLFDDFVNRQRIADSFPMWRVVGAGLACRSDEWASLAMNWLPELPVAEKNLLREPLMQIQHAKWASQKTRQLARRYARLPPENQ